MKYRRNAFLVLGLVCVIAPSGLGQTGEPMPNLIMQVGDQGYRIVLHDNPSARALLELLPLEIEMHELGGNEKYHNLPDDLPAEDERPVDIRTGDFMLYSSNCLVVFYKSFTSSYSYTKLGYVEDPTDLAQALGGGKISVSFSIEPHAQ